MIATLQSERAVAGAVLVDTPGHYWPSVRSFLRAEDFQDETCRSVYAAACRLADDGKPVDAVIIARTANIDNNTATELMDCMPTATNVRQYAEFVHNGAACRMLAELGESLTKQAIEGGANAAEIATAMAARLDALTVEDSAHNVLSATDAAELLVTERAEGSETLLHSFPSLDRFIGGFAPGRLYIIAARPGIGKSALGIGVAQILAKRFRVLYVSLEMSASEISARVVSAICGIPYSGLLNHAKLTDEQEQNVAAATSAFSRLNLFVNSAPSASVVDIGCWVRETKAQIVVLDHIGLVRGDAKLSEYERITRISRDLKTLARTLNIPVLAQCQLNRSGVANSGPKGDNRPKMHQLRSSGALEQDADGILLLHREDAFLPQAERRDPTEAQSFEIEISKNRNGRTGRVSLLWYPTNNRFVDRNEGVRHSWNLNSWT